MRRLRPFRRQVTTPFCTIQEALEAVRVSPETSLIRGSTPRIFQVSFLPLDRRHELLSTGALGLTTAHNLQKKT